MGLENLTAQASEPQAATVGHTPGPWFNDGHYIIAAGPGISGQSVAVTIDDGITCNSERLANARLIAVAPETKAQRDVLLFACKQLLQLHYDSGTASVEGLDIVHKAIAAIANAEGKEQAQ